MYYLSNGQKNVLRVAGGAAVGLLAILTIWVMASCTAPSRRDNIVAPTPPATAGPPDSSPSAGEPPVIDPSGTPSPTPGSGGSTNGSGTNGSGTNGGGTDGSGGDGSGGGSDGGGQVDENYASPKKCYPYDPTALSVREFTTGWAMMNGPSIMALLDNKIDALDLIKVATRYTTSCYIGLGNHRPHPSQYIVRYWEGLSGLPLEEAPPPDCKGYTKSLLRVAKSSAGDWWLLSGGTKLLKFDTVNDAERGKLVALAHSQLCFIGRDNTRPDHDAYTVEYWL